MSDEMIETRHSITLKAGNYDHVHIGRAFMDKRVELSLGPHVTMYNWNAIELELIIARLQKVVEVLKSPYYTQNYAPDPPFDPDNM